MKYINSLQERKVIRYLTEHPDLYIDAGASRMVFQCSTDICDYLDLPEKDCNAYIIKVVMGLGGLTQMETEVDTYNRHGWRGYFAEIVAVGRYIEIMESVDTYDFSDYADGADCPDLYEELMDYYGISEEEALQAANAMDALNSLFGYTSDNGQLGKTRNGNFVAYDYGFIPGYGHDSQTSDISDYIWKEARRCIYLKGLTELLDKEQDFMEDWEKDFLQEHCDF